MGDHVESPLGTFKLRSNLLARVGSTGHHRQAEGGLRITGDGEPGDVDVRCDQPSVYLVAAHRVHPYGDRLEDAIAPLRQIVHRRSKRGIAARGSQENARATEEDGDEQRERDECDERGDDRNLHAVYPDPPRAVRARSSLAIAGATSNRSPITTMSANSAIGASGSRLTAMIVPAVCIPTLC